MSSAFVAPRGVRPQQSALLWLAVRLSLNVRGRAAVRLLRLAAGTALVSSPLIVWVAAAMSGPRSAALPAGTMLSLALACCPGSVLTVWAARALAADRTAVADALRQVGAERAAAWMLPAARIALAAALGTLAGAAGLAVLRTTLFHELPQHAPLRATVSGISDGNWAAAAGGVVLLLVVCTLFGSGSGHRMAGRFMSSARRPAARRAARQAAELETRSASDPQAGPETHSEAPPATEV